MSVEFTTEDAKNVANAAVAVRANNVATQITALRAGNASLISSIEADDFDSRLAVVDAVTNSEAIDENLGKTINLTHFVVQAVEMVNERTGEVETVPRTILIDADGTAYHAISKGIFSGIENIVGIMGAPGSWPRPIPVHAVKKTAKVGKVMTLKLGEAVVTKK